jgi:hypothetical protein
MDIYHIWFNLKDGIRDSEFAESTGGYLDHLKGEGALVGYRITRCKLGLGPPQLPQWRITLDFENMAQMDKAFDRVSSRAGPIESLHHAVNSKCRTCSSRFIAIFPIPAG